MRKASSRWTAAAAMGGAIVLSAASARADAHGHGGKPAPSHGHPHDKGDSKTTSRTTPDAGARRVIAGGPTSDDAAQGVETAELASLREAERELFPPAAPDPGTTWPADAPLLLPGDDSPRVFATGLPPAQPAAPPVAQGGKDLAWITKLELPDLPVRWDDRVVRYLEFFRDDPRGRATFARLWQRSGRFRDRMKQALRKKKLPEDLVWVAMIESGFEQVARSSAGAAGLWQLMPETARIYGLSIDRWVDPRLDASLATDAAADFLADLHRRFGSWDLALAAYNMGYAGLTAVVRRYNTNDFWSLARTEGTLPWETTLYVPKILAAAVVAHNLQAFGLADAPVDPPIEVDDLTVPPGTPLSLVAQVVGCTTKDLEALNPELRAGRTPPSGEGDAVHPVHVPRGKGGAAVQAFGRAHKDAGTLDKYVVRFGETLDQVAAARKTTVAKLVELNGIAPGEAVRGGTVLIVPRVDPPATAATPAPGGLPAVPAATPGAKQGVVVPADVFVYPDRRRVFYRVQVADALPQIASALHVGVDDLDRWNDVDPGARLQEGMTLQAFVPQSADLSRVVVVLESDVHVLPIGSDEFFASLERDRGFKRVTVTAKTGDTLESIGKHFDVPVKTMERVNRRGRGDTLQPGQTVVVYVPAPASGGSAAVASAVPDLAAAP